MKLLWIHQVLAHGVKLCTWGGSLVSFSLYVWWSFPTLTGPITLSDVLWFGAGLVASVPLGWLLGGLYLGVFVSAIARRINGAPYVEGDKIRILVGPYKNRVTDVYEVWTTRNQIRVDLGEEAKKNVTDVFFAEEVSREKNSEDNSLVSRRS